MKDRLFAIGREVGYDKGKTEGANMSKVWKLFVWSWRTVLILLVAWLISEALSIDILAVITNALLEICVGFAAGLVIAHRIIRKEMEKNA